MQINRWIHYEICMNFNGANEYRIYIQIYLYLWETPAWTNYQECYPYYAPYTHIERVEGEGSIGAATLTKNTHNPEGSYFNPFRYRRVYASHIFYSQVSLNILGICSYI